MRTRSWPIRSKIVALVIVPLAALLALWIFATTLTLGPALSLLSAKTLFDEVGRPGERLVAELQNERRLSLIYLAGRERAAELHDQRARTDQAIADFRRHASGSTLRDAANDLVMARVDQTIAALDVLPSGRGFIDRREVDVSGALGLYSGVISSAFQSFTALATLPDDDINRRVRALTSFGQARELLNQADALLAGVFAAGSFAGTEYSQFVQIIGSQRFLQSAAAAELRDADRVAYRHLTEGEAFVRLDSMIEEVISKGHPGVAPAVDAAAWHSSHEAVQEQLREFELSASKRLAEDSIPVAVGILLRLALAGVVGLAAIVVSLLIAVRIGRALVNRLTGLRAVALEMAEDRLPDVVGRLRRGEEVDVAAEAPPLRYGNDEIGQVGHAFSEVQRTAVQSAVEEAALRRGLSEVFLNIARRSQTLLHRQLSVLDRMERRTTEPEELEDLFRIDHLATRMRRHAEDLVVLAGATPGRGWRNPVAMIDVIRGAVSEVEDYARVDIVTVQPAATAGRAVGDVIHLLAELIENATAYSPPHTRVQVAGQTVPNGYAIEIEDRGLGMPPEVIDDANRRLAKSPDFDPANSARLGLFVVARLCARHGVRVRLRPSPYGGITAVALIPSDLVVLSGPGARALPDRGDQGSGRGTSASGRDRETPQDVHRSPAVLLPAGAPAQPSAESSGGVSGEIRRAPMPAQRPPIEDASEAGGPVGDGSGRPPRRRPSDRPADGGGADGLPRRVRQTSLVPQLRKSGAAVPASPREPAFRSPDEVRAAMSALQAGTARGRRDASSGRPAGPAVWGTDMPPVDTALIPPDGGGTAEDGSVTAEEAVSSRLAGPVDVAEEQVEAGAAVTPDATEEAATDSGRNA